MLPAAIAPAGTSGDVCEVRCEPTTTVVDDAVGVSTSGMIIESALSPYSHVSMWMGFAEELGSTEMKEAVTESAARAAGRARRSDAIVSIAPRIAPFMGMSCVMRPSCDFVRDECTCGARARRSDASAGADAPMSDAGMTRKPCVSSEASDRRGRMVVIADALRWVAAEREARQEVGEERWRVRGDGERHGGGCGGWGGEDKSVVDERGWGRIAEMQAAQSSLWGCRVAFDCK